MARSTSGPERAQCQCGAILMFLSDGMGHVRQYCPQCKNSGRRDRRAAPPTDPPAQVTETVVLRELGDWFIRYRDERNLTQRGLAKILGVHEMTVHDIEHGSRPNIRTRTRIESALGLRVLTRAEDLTTIERPHQPEDTHNDTSVSSPVHPTHTAPTRESGQLAGRSRTRIVSALERVIEAVELLKTAIGAAVLGDA